MRRALKFVPLVLLVTFVVEITAFVALGRLAGFDAALLLVMLASLTGVVLIRREGVRAWRRFQAAVSECTPPGEQVTDGLAGLAGALLLAVPGLVSGLLGLVLLAPPGRGLAARAVRRLAERRISSSAAGGLFGPRKVRVSHGAGWSNQAPPAPPQAGRNPVIDGEVLPPR